MALLDTHTFIWFAFEAPQLSPTAKGRIEGEDQVFLSIASVWEMAIKISTGKLELPPLVDFVTEQMEKAGIRLLPIALSHLAQVAQLPFHRRDPFDRLIIAQSLIEKMPVISIDAAFDAYGVSRLW